MPNPKLSLKTMTELTVKECFEEYINWCTI